MIQWLFYPDGVDIYIIDTIIINVLNISWAFI